MAKYCAIHREGQGCDTANLSGFADHLMGTTEALFLSGKVKTLYAYVDAQDEDDAIEAAHTLWQRDYNWEPPVKEREWVLIWDAGGWREANHVATGPAPVRFYPDSKGFFVTVMAATFKEACIKADQETRTLLAHLSTMPHSCWEAFTL